MEESNVIHLLKADAGDCILIKLDEKKCILIDCGYKSTYINELKPMLKDLSVSGYRIALLIITHYDEDHIQGANFLIKENGDSLHPKIIGIDEIWFNGIFRLIQSSQILKKHIVKKISEQQSIKYRVVLSQLTSLIGSGDGLISASLAENFEELCMHNHYVLNQNFENGLIMTGCNKRIGKYIINCLSPDKKRLEKLLTWVDNKCISCMGKNYELEEGSFILFLRNMLLASGRELDPIPRYSEISSDCPNIENWIGSSSMSKMNDVNRASIVIEICSQGKRLLFAGDSESSDWIINAASEYDLVKLSHHGTTKPNLAILDNVTFKKALISTNGKRNHPEDDLLARLIKKGISCIYFNYEIPRTNAIKKLEEKYSFKAYFGEKIYF